jgi:hypothetical protein
VNTAMNRSISIKWGEFLDYSRNSPPPPPIRNLLRRIIGENGLMEGRVVGKKLLVRKKHHVEVSCGKDKGIVAANIVPCGGTWY